MDLAIFGIVSLVLGFLLNTSPRTRAIKLGLSVALFVAFTILGLLSIQNFDSGPVPSLKPGDWLTDLEVFIVVFITFLLGRFLRNLLKKKLIKAF